MRLYTFATLCACALYVRAASIPSDKKLDDLDNVDLDIVEPELVDQPTVTDLDNNLRKTADIPVKVIEESPVLDENSNDYVPDKDENVIIKRVEIDLDNPGPPQRQEHETQNPENYGENERASFAIIQKAQEAQKIFTKGLQAVSDSFKNINGPNEDLPNILQNIKSLKESFTNEIEKLNITVRNNLKPEIIKSNGKHDTISKLDLVDNRLQNLDLKFRVGIDTLNEGVELLSILKEEDEAAKTKALVNENNEETKADTDGAASVPSAVTPQNPPPQVPTNALSQFMSNLQTTVSNGFSDFIQFFQNPSSSQGQNGGNIIGNLFQGINIPSFISGQNPTSQATSTQNPGSPPVEALSDTPASVQAPTPAPTQAPAWGPQALIQQFQSTIQNIANLGQGNQQAQQTQQTTTAAPGPLSQAFQGIIQFIQRPGQTLFPQQSQSPPQSSTTGEKVPVSQSSPPKQPESTQPLQANDIPTSLPSVPVPIPSPVSTPVAGAVSNTQAEPQSAPPQEVQAAPTQAKQPISEPPKEVQPAPATVQNGPIREFVQNNPIIKGIQSAVQRIQYPNGETPREEIAEKEAEKETKGHYNSNAQGNNNDCSRLKEKVEEQKQETIAAEEPEIESGIKPEETKSPSISDKTE